MAVGGGGGGGEGGDFASPISGRNGNSGTGGACSYMGYYKVSGATTISFTIGAGGAGGSGWGTGLGGNGGDTVVSYNGLTYVTARGGPGGQKGGTYTVFGYTSSNNAAQTASTARTGRWTVRQYDGTYEIYTLNGPFVAANNSGFETGQLDVDKYVNASSSGSGYGGDGGKGAVSGIAANAGTAGSGGWVSIFEYFN